MHCMACRVALEDFELAGKLIRKGSRYTPDSAPDECSRMHVNLTSGSYNIDCRIHRIQD